MLLRFHSIEKWNHKNTKAIRSTKNNNLLLALEKAKERVAENKNKKSATASMSKIITRHDIKANVAFNVLYPTQEPLLNVADYFCWAVQRVFEK